MECLIGRKLHSIRQIVGIPQHELAVIMGISRSQYSQIESEKFNPTLNNLTAIARYFNIPYEFFLENNVELTGFVNNQLLKHKKVIEPFKNTNQENLVKNIKKCMLCAKNEEIIESQKDLIQQLKENNSLLKDKLKDCLENPPKKKAS